MFVTIRLLVQVQKNISAKCGPGTRRKRLAVASYDSWCQRICSTALITCEGAEGGV